MGEKNPYRGQNVFAITICPNDNYQHFGVRNRSGKYSNFMSSLMLESPNDKIDYLFYNELSTPIGTMKDGYRGPRYHSHGIIRLRNKKALFHWLDYWLPSLLKVARVEITNLNDKESWRTYCKKDQDWMPIAPISNMEKETLWDYVNGIERSTRAESPELKAQADANEVCVQD